MWQQLGTGFKMMLVLTVLTGLLYPGVVTGLCQVFFPARANGSLIVANGQAIGSELIGQNFKQARVLPAAALRGRQRRLRSARLPAHPISAQPARSWPTG